MWLITVALWKRYTKVWTTKRQGYLTLKNEGYLFKVGKMSIGCNKIKNSQLLECRWLQWIAMNKQAHVYKWVRSSLLITSFFGFLCDSILHAWYMHAGFFCHWSDHERNMCCYDLVYGNSKIAWKFKASMLLSYGSCFLIHSLLGSWNNFSCFLKFNFGKVILFLVDYDH